MQKEHPFRSVRRAGVPLIAIETSDPRVTIATCMSKLKDKEQPCVEWDCMRGIVGLNRNGLGAQQKLSPQGAIDTMNPGQSLEALAAIEKHGKLTEDLVVFWHMAPRYIEPFNVSIAQGIWNLREIFKAKHATLVLLASQIQLPDELKHDCIVISEPLPNTEELRAVIDQLLSDAGIKGASEADKVKMVDTVLGLSAFAAEQVLAMSASPEGVDMSALWERKRKMIEQTPGLTVWRGGETFDQIGGCVVVKDYLKRIMAGNAPPRAICFIDEIEKAMAGAQSDSSGVTQDYLGTLLAWMQNKEATGVIFIGPPGAAKSAVAKAAGNEGNIPTIQVDFGGMKGSLVGESERRLRQALQVIDAVSQGATLFIATCNSISQLPPELRRRFTLGTFFFDLPDLEEREGIWKIYIQKYQLSDKGGRPEDNGWTGAEIKQCCQTAWRLKCSLKEAGKFVVPVYKSAPDTISKLRKEASDRFLNAAAPGLYQHVDIEALNLKKTRKFEN